MKRTVKPIDRAGTVAAVLPVLLLGLLAFSTASPAFAQADLSKPRGTLLLIGGGLPEVSVDELQTSKTKLTDPCFCDPCGALRLMLSLSPARHPPIECVTCADEDDTRLLGEQHKTLLLALGASQVNYIAATDRGEVEHNTKITERIKRADIVLLCGGDQSLLDARFGGTDACKAMLDRYAKDEHFVLAGNSAGAMIMAKRMIIGDAPTADQPPPSAQGWNVLPCTIDTHVGPRRRRRLGELVSHQGTGIGLAIPTQSALVLKDGKAEVFGDHVLVVCRKGIAVPDAFRGMATTTLPALGCEKYEKYGLVAKCYEAGVSLRVKDVASAAAAKR